jgi:hypothetical protein
MIVNEDTYTTKYSLHPSSYHEAQPHYVIVYWDDDHDVRILEYYDNLPSHLRPVIKSISESKGMLYIEWFVPVPRGFEVGQMVNAPSDQWCIASSVWVDDPELHQPYSDPRPSSIYRDITVYWDEDRDKRVFTFIDQLPDQLRPQLKSAAERKGCIDLEWRGEVPPGYAEGMFVHVENDIWTITGSTGGWE